LPADAPHGPPPGFWDGFTSWENWTRPFCAGCAAHPGSHAITTFDADYVFWLFPKTKQDTTLGGVSSLDATGFPVTGVIPIEQLPNSAFERHVTSGGRFALGYWLTDCQPAAPDNSIRVMGAEARYFFVSQHSLMVDSNAVPILIRPFFDINNRRESGLPIAAPGLATGDLSAHLQRDMWGFEGNFWRNLCHDYPETTISVDAMVGIRYLEFDTRAQINGVSVFDKNITMFPLYEGFSGNRIDMYESFSTRNQFYGVQYGVSGKIIFEDLIINLALKMALGVTHQELKIVGSELRTFPGGGQTLSQGWLLALPSNIGTFSKNRFGFVPDLDINFAYPVWRHLNLKFGFEAMYLNRIIRAVEQVNRAVDITQIPNYPPALTATPTGLNQPNIPYRQTDVWLIGGTAGLEIIW
jgi:hypothetical protein